LKTIFNKAHNLKHTTHFFLLITLLLSLATCTSPTNQPATGLRVVATTTLVGDVIRNIGGEAIQLSVLLPVGSDPHSFQPTPQDAARLADADVVFINGAGLETFMQTLLQNSGSQAKVVDLSAGITLLQGGVHDKESATGDPHVWTDPNNVMVWVQNAQQALSQLDPANASVYQANASAYNKQMVELDAWIQQQVSLVPAERRKLVMDHEILGYFAQRYGFEQVGAVIPGFNTLSEPSAQELAALEDAIHSLGVPAIFVSFDVSPALAQRVANDTNIKLVYIYSGSLSQPGGPADTYVNFTRYNVTAIVEALK
jgi:manganese/iron transport system substrate-binding protein